MAVNYRKIALKAQAPIKANGVQYTFRKYDRTLADATAPWDGPTSTVAGDGTVERVQHVMVLHPSDLASWGISKSHAEALLRTNKIIVVPQGLISEDLSDFDEVYDGAVTYRIDVSQTLKPGARTLLHFMGLSR